MRLGTDTGSMINHLMSGTRGAPTPVVGMGATILGWTDRHPATIVAVSKTGSWVEIQEDNAKRTDSNGMSECQDYEFTPNTEAQVCRYSLRKNGAYVRVGDSVNGSRLRIGERSKYYDYSF